MKSRHLDEGTKPIIDGFGTSRKYRDFNWLANFLHAMAPQWHREEATALRPLELACMHTTDPNFTSDNDSIFSHTFAMLNPDLGAGMPFFHVIVEVKKSLIYTAL